MARPGQNAARRKRKSTSTPSAVTKTSASPSTSSKRTVAIDRAEVHRGLLANDSTTAIGKQQRVSSEEEEDMDLDDDDQEGQDPEMQQLNELDNGANVDNDDNDEVGYYEEEAYVEEEYYSEEEEEESYAGLSKGKVGGGSRVLPVGKIGKSFNGEILDGATYLAVAFRDNAKLPSYTRASLPSFGNDNTPRSSRPSTSVSLYENADAGPSRASAPRHPALPQESWEVLFPIHFSNCHKCVQESWPPAPTPLYPTNQPILPNDRDPKDVLYFINGYPRARIRLNPDTSSSETHMNTSQIESCAGTGMNGVVMDEEEMMNQPTHGLSHTAAKKKMKDAQTGDTKAVYGPEPKGPRHDPREPVLGFISRLTTDNILNYLNCINTHLMDVITPLSSALQLPKQYTIEPTIPTAPDKSSSDESESSSESETSSESSTYSHSRPSKRSRQARDGASEPTAANPLSTHLTKWIFSLLLALDGRLSGDQISILRELARTVMKVAGWRWVYAVTNEEVDETFKLGQSIPLASKSAAVRSQAEAVPHGEGSGRAKNESSVDETLARCWLLIYAVASGWGQTDLIEDVAGLFT